MTAKRFSNRFKAHVLWGLLGVVFLQTSETKPDAQGFVSGSTGVDGAFSPVGIGRLNTSRYEGATVSLASGKVLLVGGFANNPLASAEVFDPATGLFTFTGSLATPRYDHVAVRMANGRVLVAGGVSATRLASAELYDPVAGGFSAAGTMGFPRSAATATLLQDGRVLVTGGVSAANVPLREAEIYDPISNSFSPTGSMTTVRAYHEAALLSDGRVLIVGGLTNTQSGAGLASAEIFDPATGSFTATPGAMSSARYRTAATTLPNGSVLVTGGQDASNSSVNSADLFNPVSGLFAPTSRMISARYTHSATLLSNGQVLVAGGPAAAELYDPVAGVFSATAGSLTAVRFWAYTSRLADGRVLLAGGWNGSSANQTADIYDPVTRLFSTILFNPKAYNPPLDVDGDNIYHFTTINIPSGVTVRVSGDTVRGPLYWLASGNVTIDGTLDLSGSYGPPYTSVSALRTVSTPGPGGFPGGVGGNPTYAPQAGSGPGGGQPDTNPGARGGKFTANAFLVPLVGGSGGAGARSGDVNWGSGGGAGGGAILIASSVSVAVNGTINAEGGRTLNAGEANCIWRAGAGAGGAIRLAAPLISGTGTFSVVGGADGGISCGLGGAPGLVRLEALDNRYAGPSTVTRASPYELFLPTAPPPSVRVVSVNGVAVPPSPTGSFSAPDVKINANGPTAVVIEARQVPAGTVVELHLFSENGADQTISTPPLAGNLESSSTTVQVTFPPGFTRGYPRAVWRLP